MRIFRYMRAKLFLISTTIFLLGCGQSDLTRPNILIIVADDLNYDSPGFTGGVAPDVTPNLDCLASESFLFKRAFGAVSVCQPSRQSMLSGLLPNHYGSAGFFPMREGTPTLPSLLAEVGYVTGNIHKKHHMMPYDSFNWAYDNEKLGLTQPDGYVGRDPEAMAEAFRKFIRHAEKENKPFFMVVNSADPHRPFYGDPHMKGGWYWGDKDLPMKTPSRVYTPEEVIVPPALPDIPGIRKDLAKYASSVRRLDDAVGECLSVLKQAGKESSTIVIFVSDNGMPLPFAKFDCYFGSNRTPLLIRLPDHGGEYQEDDEHLVSLMDITPTVLELTKTAIPENLDGKSLVPFLENRSPEDWREFLVFLRNDDIYYPEGIKNALKRNPDFITILEKKGWVLRPDHPEKGTYSRRKEMRTFFDGRFGYIYNNWYREDGLKISPLGAGVPYSDPSLNAMRMASKEDSAIQDRYQYYLLREPEELYDWSEDPGSHHNLIDDPDYADILIRAREGLLNWMISSNDTLTDEYDYFLDQEK